MAMRRKKGEKISPPSHTHMHAHTEKAAQREGGVEGSSSILSSRVHARERARTRGRDGEARRKYLSLRDGICFHRAREGGTREEEMEGKEREKETGRTIRGEKNLPLLPLSRACVHVRERRD